MFCEHILMDSSRCRAFNGIVTVLVSIKNLNKSKSGLMMTKDDLMANDKNSSNLIVQQTLLCLNLP